MSNPITTSGTAPEVSTKCLPGEGPSSWVTRHNAAVQSATPTGNTLSTSWTSVNGRQTVSTTRDPGETDEDFLLRHIHDYLVAMLEEPPVP